MSTVTTLQLADTTLPVAPGRLGLVAGVALGHAVTAATDQFVSNVVRAEGGLHQVLTHFTHGVRNTVWLYGSDLLQTPVCP